MNEHMKDRLDELRAELESGQRALADLEAKETELRNTLSRMRGAIRVLEEELGDVRSADRSRAPPDHAPSRKLRERP
jgi:uncharacterized coiled-coil protein SlyX